MMLGPFSYAPAHIDKLHNKRCVRVRVHACVCATYRPSDASQAIANPLLSNKNDFSWLHLALDMETNSGKDHQGTKRLIKRKRHTHTKEKERKKKYQLQEHLQKKKSSGRRMLYVHRACQTLRSCKASVQMQLGQLRKERR